MMKNPPDKPTVFLTGATGLVGSYLLKILLKKGHKVYCLARPKKEKTAQQRIAEVLNFWDKTVYPRFRKNLHIIDGDITERDLGLKTEKLSLLRNSINQIFHCAAITDLNSPLKEVQRVNVNGTQAILDLALKCQESVRVFHVSTIYVCGNYKKNFTENDLDVGQKFNSPYEQSKYEAESLITEFRKRSLQIDIFRAPIISAEYNTGKIIEFKNIYQLVSVCKSQIFTSLPFDGASLNIVPVDSFCEAMYALSKQKESNNSCYHILTKAVSLKTIIDIAARKFHFSAPNIVKRNVFIVKNLTPLQAKIINKFSNLLNFETNIDSALTLNRLKKIGFKKDLAKWKF